jgi:predicted carbohydrate-binding protein with CBM5 and CBM33 domain
MEIIPMGRSNKTVLLTAADIIDALGGYRKVQNLTGAGYTSVCNWKAFGAFPARYYVVMMRTLEKRGYSASPTLWDQREVA